MVRFTSHNPPHLVPSKIAIEISLTYSISKSRHPFLPLIVILLVLARAYICCTSTEMIFLSRVLVQLKEVRGSTTSIAKWAESMRRHSPMKPMTDGSTNSSSPLQDVVVFDGGSFTFRLPFTWTSCVVVYRYQYYYDPKLVPRPVPFSYCVCILLLCSMQHWKLGMSLRTRLHKCMVAAQTVFPPRKILSVGKTDICIYLVRYYIMYNSQQCSTMKL